MPFVQLLLAAVLFVQYQAKTPNFVFIVIDDLHYTTDWDHSYPPGNELASGSIPRIDVRTPYIQDMLDDGGVIIPRTYAGAPKCAPSRFSLLTGRYPARGEFAIKQTGKAGDTKYGTTVSVSTVAIHGVDIDYNIHNTLQNNEQNPYYTAQVGKWQLFCITDDCENLRNEINAKLYESCRTDKEMAGFDFVDAFYVTNIGRAPYSHNPEWIVSSAKKAVKNAEAEDKPFFLYMALTLTHSPDVIPTLETHTIKDSPKGDLKGDEIPYDSGMRPRSEVLADVRAKGLDNEQAAIMWADEAIGAFLGHLKDAGVYDNTFISIMSDHGISKDTLYDQGTRIPQFVRYPPLFNKNNERKTPFVMPDDFITSNVDLAATVFKLAEVSLPDGYIMDGTDYSSAVENAIYGKYNNKGFTERFADVYDSHTIITANYQYIWRARLEMDDHLYHRLSAYAGGYDMEQIYDLNADPNQQTNLLDEGARDAHLGPLICEFKDKMHEYMENEICVNPLDCTYPARGICDDDLPPPEKMCCTANEAMSLAMGRCAPIMQDFKDPLGQSDACAREKDTCKWVPCSQVGVCVQTSDELSAHWSEISADISDEVLDADAGGRADRKANRAPKPAKEPRTKRPRPTKAPRIKPTRAPKPTKPVDVPLTGCAAHMAEGQCVNECEWKVGYPAGMIEEMFVQESSLIVGDGVDYLNMYWMAGYASLVLMFLFFAARYFSNKGSKKLLSKGAETSPLLV